MATDTAAPVLGTHGASRLPSVTVDTCNAEIKDEDGFVGDKASRGAFYDILDKWRKPLRKLGTDPFGDVDSDEIGKKKLDEFLIKGDHEAAGVITSAIEEFAQTLAKVTKRFLKLKSWDKTDRIVIGGGLRESRIGELAIGRADVLLKADGHKTDLIPIRHHPDEAGLIGSVHLAPAWIFKAHDSILAVDIGGTNIRCGVVEPNVKKASDLSKAVVWKSELWRHADDSPNREETVDRLVGMLDTLAKRAIKEGHSLAPFVGIACPGAIEDDGSIAKGAQNLPGNWESSKFNLPRLICEKLPTWDDHDTVVLMHNDAVVQGLSEVPFMQDVKRWGVLTIGTGLGNARFTNHTTKKEKD